LIKKSFARPTPGLQQLYKKKDWIDSLSRYVSVQGRREATEEPARVTPEKVWNILVHLFMPPDVLADGESDGRSFAPRLQRQIAPRVTKLTVSDLTGGRSSSTVLICTPHTEKHVGNPCVVKVGPLQERATRAVGL
jgi:hypothetical protein